MPFAHRRKSWDRNAGPVTPEAVYMDRRQFLAGATAAIAASAAMTSGCSAEPAPGEAERLATNYGPRPPIEALTSRLPARRNEAYKVDRAMTEPRLSLGYNNFYEFGTGKEDPAKNSGNFTTSPWTLEIGGMVKQARTIAFEDLLKQVDLEERVYRFRCVEAWSMTVPWTGFPLRKLIELCEPRGDAKYVRFVSMHRPEEMPGQKAQTWHPYPYFEGLRMDEATNELGLVVVGIYGKPIPNQTGAPLRLALPWKYGYKGPKSVVKIEFTDQKPETFWNKLQPREYGFFSNVEPTKPHPRWSQATEEVLGTGERVPTLLYNGYADQVAPMYDGREF